MKAAFFAILLPASILAGIIHSGCADTNAIAPVVGSQAPVQPKPSPTAQTILLRGFMREPGLTFNSFIAIDGRVEYRMDEIWDKSQVSLNLVTDAELRPFESGKPVWTVSGNSRDVVSLSDDGVAFVEKHYQVQGRGDGMVLYLRFQVTQGDVELSGMRLELDKVGSTPVYSR